MSWMERSFHDWLSSIGMNGKYQYEIHFFDSDNKKSYYVDFLFEDIKLIIELDGSQHVKTIKEDKIRDLFFETLGYTVCRITHVEYINKTKLETILLLLAPLAGIEPTYSNYSVNDRLEDG